MKKLLIALLLLTSGMAQAATRDEACLTIGRYAASIAEARELGTSEKELLEMVKGKIIERGATQVINYVFTMELKKEEARKIVYLKCLGDGLGRRAAK